MRTYEGLIEIDLAKLWTWVVENHLLKSGDVTTIGLPTIDVVNGTLQAPYVGPLSQQGEFPEFLSAHERKA